MFPREARNARLKVMCSTPGATIRLDGDTKLIVSGDDSAQARVLARAQEAVQIMGVMLGWNQGRDLVLTVYPKTDMETSA